jgi:PBP1b-binding outer membrane lipoprotein LpoB
LRFLSRINVRILILSMLLVGCSSEEKASTEAEDQSGSCVVSVNAAKSFCQQHNNATESVQTQAKTACDAWSSDSSITSVFKDDGTLCDTTDIATPGTCISDKFEYVYYTGYAANAAAVKEDCESKLYTYTALID